MQRLLQTILGKGGGGGVEYLKTTIKFNHKKPSATGEVAQNVHSA